MPKWTQLLLLFSKNKHQKTECSRFRSKGPHINRIKLIDSIESANRNREGRLKKNIITSSRIKTKRCKEKVC